LPDWAQQRQVEEKQRLVPNTDNLKNKGSVFVWLRVVLSFFTVEAEMILFAW
jgi:hypothetical protein